MNTPFFSIIIPVYKVEKYLDECLQSVLVQSYTDYECILVNDGSPDNCPAMCDEYVKKHGQIKVIHKENGGLSDARNAGILQANGKYIVLLDSDDKLADDETLQNLSDVIQEHKTDVILNVNWFEFTDNGSRTLKNSFDKDINSGSPKEITIAFEKAALYGTAWLFVPSREHIINNNLFFKKGLLHEDEHWMPRLLFTTKQIAVNHSLFYAYRVGREGSIMMSLTPKRLFSLLKIVDDLLEWSKDEETYTKEGCYYMQQKAMVLLGVSFGYSDKIKDQDETVYPALCKEMSKSLVNILKIAIELIERSKDEKTYTEADCDYMQQKAIALLNGSFNHSDKIKQQEQAIYSSLYREMSKGLFSILEIVGDLAEREKDIKNLKKRAMALWETVFHYSDKIKQQDEAVYSALCQEMYKKLKTLSEVAKSKKHKSIFIIGVENTKLLLRFQLELKRFLKLAKNNDKNT